MFIKIPYTSQQPDLLDLYCHVIKPGVGGLVLLVGRLLVHLQGLDLGGDAVNLSLHAPENTNHCFKKYLMFLTSGLQLFH